MIRGVRTRVHPFVGDGPENLVQRPAVRGARCRTGASMTHVPSGRTVRRDAPSACRIRWLVGLALTGALLAGCSPSVGSPSGAPHGWIRHQVALPGSLVTFATPRTWTHVLGPAQNGGIWSDGVTYVANFPLHPFCWRRTDAYGCTPRRLGRMHAGSVLVSVRLGTFTWPPRTAGSLGSWPVTGAIVDGFPALVNHFGAHDGACTTWGGGGSVDYDVNLWAPAAADINVCVAGPHVARQLVIAARVVRTATFAVNPGSRAPAADVDALSPRVSETSPPLTERLPTCAGAAARPSITGGAARRGGLVSLLVRSTISSAAGVACGLPAQCVGTPGTTAFVLLSPSGAPIFTWQPIQPLIACRAGTLRLPLSIAVRWSVRGSLLPSGTYRLENGWLGTGGNLQGRPADHARLVIP